MHHQRLIPPADALDLDRQQDGDAEHGEGQPAVDKLHHDGIVDEIAQERLEPRGRGGIERVPHQRPCVEGVARVQPGDIGPEEELEEQEGQRPDGDGRHALTCRGWALEVKRGPDGQAEDREGGQEMHREAQVADVGALNEAARDHPPADRALDADQQENRDEAGLIALGDRLADPEPGQRKQHRKPDHPAEQAVDIFPEIDVLELGHAHAAIDLLIFRDLPIALELGEPLRLVQRRERSADRLPFRDRQAAFGQPGDPADHHHHEDQPGDREQPVGDGGRASERTGNLGGD